MMNLIDTVSAFQCCTQVPPRCLKCPLTEMCKWSMNRDACKNELKLSVYHWLVAQEVERQTAIGDAERAKAVNELRMQNVMMRNTTRRYWRMKIRQADRDYGHDRQPGPIARILWGAYGLFVLLISIPFQGGDVR